MAKRFSVDPASLAIAWLLHHPVSILPIMGSNNIQRIKGFSGALEVELDRQDWFELYEAANGCSVPLENSPDQHFLYNHSIFRL